MTKDPRYPIGNFDPPTAYSADLVSQHLDVLRGFPDDLRRSVAALDDSQLATPYREGGWTVRQLVHHMADSHQNASLRTRFALTMDSPTIQGYDEKSWAELPDAKGAPIDGSLRIVEGVHARWVTLMSQLSEAEWAREMIHPEFEQPLTLWWVAALYDWHSRHHLAHITELSNRLDW